MALSDAEKKELALFHKFVEKRKILIADPSSSSRSGMFMIFKELGVKPNQLMLASNYAEAEEAIQHEKPHIVVAEYDIGKKNGIELFQSQRALRPKETKECLFVIVTGNTSQSAVARASEEEIDAYILKPYSMQMVRKTLIKAAFAKIRPAAYVVKIEEGKALMEAGKLDEAEAKFNEAACLDEAPALAHYYLGQIRFMRQVMNEAQGNYSKGLSYNKIHYKCLIGLYETLNSMKKHADAYEVVKKLSHYFPANPKRLTEVLRLAIVNGQYDDIEKYYGIFINIDDRNETLLKYMCAALIVCGKYYLSRKVSQSRALQLFQKAVASSSGRGAIVREIVYALLDSEMTKEAKGFLERYPLESQSLPEYQLLKFAVLDREGNVSSTITFGRELLAKGISDERLYSIMIQRSLEANLHSAAEELYYAAIKAYPQLKDSFERQINTKKTA